MSGPETWIDSVANVLADVEGIVEVRAGGKGGYPAVKAFGTEPTTPGISLSLGPGTVIAGSWERIRFEAIGRVWLNADQIGDAYGEVGRYPIRVLDCLRAKAKGGLPAELASVLLTGWDEPEVVQWIAGSGHFYLVLPFTLEVIVNNATGYTPA